MPNAWQDYAALIFAFYNRSGIVTGPRWNKSQFRFFKSLTKKECQIVWIGMAFACILKIEILYIMKKLIYIIGIFLIAGFLFGEVANAQNVKLTKREKHHLEQLRKKKERSMKRAISREYYTRLLKDKYFVFQADFLTGPQGTSFILSPDINFMSVNGNKVILQFGLNGVIGWNGVGGITVNGTLSDYEIHTGEKKNNLTMRTNVNLIGPGLPPNISMNVSDDGTGQLIVQPAGGPPFIVYGQIVAPKKANIFIGQSLF